MSKRSTIFGMLLLAATVAAAWMLPRSKPAPSRLLEIQPEAFRTGPVEFNDGTLEQAINQLATRTRANIVVHWRDIRVSGYEPTRRIHLGFGDEPLGKAVRMIFLASQTEETLALQRSSLLQPLALWTIDGVLHVSLANRADGFATFRVYDANALSVWDVWPEESVFPVPVSRSASFHSTPLSRLDIVVRLIEETCDPNSWRDNGGLPGSIWELDGFLLIRQTSEVHEQLATLAAVWKNERRRIQAGEPPTSKGIDLLEIPVPRSKP